MSLLDHFSATGCKVDASVSTHVLKVIGYIERLEVLRFKMDKDLEIDLILQSLPESFKAFILNFNMNQLERSLSDLLNMLKVAEKGSQEG